MFTIVVTSAKGGRYPNVPTVRAVFLTNHDPQPAKPEPDEVAKKAPLRCTAGSPRLT